LTRTPEQSARFTFYREVVSTIFADIARRDGQLRKNALQLQSPLIGEAIALPNAKPRRSHL
jgi:hypothetical protein